MNATMGDGICRIGAIDFGIWIVDVCFIVFTIDLGEFTRICGGESTKESTPGTPTSLALLLEALEADETSILNGFMRRIDGGMMADSSWCSTQNHVEVGAT
jgi:hypothetical protein